MYYYAKVDENNICYDVDSSETPITNEGYVEITEEQFLSASILDLQWNAETGEWQTPFVYIGTTDEVDYKGTGTSLTVKLDTIDTAIESKADEAHTHSQNDITGLETALSGKANTSDLHAHNNKTVLDGVTADKVTAWDGKAEASHTHEQYATTESMNTALSGKSDSNHTHSQYATTTAMNEAISESAYVHPATHSANMITGLSEVATTGSYNDLEDLPTIPTVPASLPANGGNADTVDNKHADDFATANHNHNSDYADIAHTHAQSDITGLTTALSGKADTSHTHTNYATTEDLSAIETAVNSKANTSHTHAQSDITGLATALSGKASTTHTHSNYALTTDVEELSETVDTKASATHNHAQSDITGLVSALSGKANATHTHSDYVTNTDFATLEDTVDGKANVTHTHTQSEITGLTSALSGKASTSHVHSNYALATDLNTLSDTVDGKANANHTHTLDGISDTTSYVKMTAAERTKLSGIATGANKTVVDSALSSTSTNPVQNKVINTALAGKANSSHTHTLDNISETTDKKILTATERTKLSGIAEGANKTTVDSSLSATSTNPVQNKVVNTALDNKVDKVSGKGLSTNDYTTTEKNKLAGIATGANAYTHPSYTAKSSGLYKVAVDNTGHISATTAVAKSDITALGIPSTNTTYSNATTSTAGLLSASDKSKLDGIATGANKTTVDSALSSTSTNPVQNKVINTALAGKADTSHNHDSAYISKSLQMTADDGDVMVSWTNQDVVAKIKALTAGMYTAYAKSGTTNNPKTTESWRFMVHKTSEAYGWVQAFGSAGSMYIGYVDNSTWKGWKCLYDASPVVLWYGNYWITETQTVTPSKALSECKNGWVLVWSDYDTANEKPANADFFTTVIPKKNGANANWSGQSFIATIPYNMSDTKDEITCKRLYVHDTKITGHASNDTSPRNDVCLRAIYEY